MIIADDGSSEETRVYLRSITVPRVRTIWLEHCGNPSRVRNAAIEAASGRYLAFLDSDDIWAPSKLEKQIGARLSLLAALQETSRTAPLTSYLGAIAGITLVTTALMLKHAAHDGVHERLYPDPSGEPNSFPDAQAMAQKFLTLARPVLNGRADQLADAILSLERFDRVEKATQLGRR